MNTKNPRYAWINKGKAANLLKTKFLTKKKKNKQIKLKLIIFKTSRMYERSLMARNEEVEVNARKRFYASLYDDEFHIRLGEITGRKQLEFWGRKSGQCRKQNESRGRHIRKQPGSRDGHIKKQTGSRGGHIRK